MNQFVFKNITKEEAKEAIDKVVSSTELPNIVKIEWQDSTLLLTITKMGVSKVAYDLTQEGNDSFLTEKERSISIMHRPFITMAETIIEKMIVEAGGNKFILLTPTRPRNDF